jgi:hypothetical protein
MRKELNDLRYRIKEGIVKQLAEIYLLKNGCYPNWSADEELVVEDTDLPHNITIENYVETENGYIVERDVIEEFRVNCGGGLFFVWGDGMCERSWEDEATETLIGLYEFLVRTNEGR